MHEILYAQAYVMERFEGFQIDCADASAIKSVVERGNVSRTDLLLSVCVCFFGTCFKSFLCSCI